MDNNIIIEFEDMLCQEGILFRGFGVMSKIAMLDVELSLKSRAILAYLCSYAGGGVTAFPSVKKILKDLDISKDTFYKHTKLLIDTGYVNYPRP